MNEIHIEQMKLTGKRNLQFFFYTLVGKTCLYEALNSYITAVEKPYFPLPSQKKKLSPNTTSYLNCSKLLTKKCSAKVFF